MKVASQSVTNMLLLTPVNETSVPERCVITKIKWNEICDVIKCIKNKQNFSFDLINFQFYDTCIDKEVL
jgi:hypothetical protein